MRLTLRRLNRDRDERLGLRPPTATAIVSTKGHDRTAHLNRAEGDHEQHRHHRKRDKPFAGVQNQMPQTHDIKRQQQTDKSHPSNSPNGRVF
jgi:hypothetical protein